MTTLRVQHKPENDQKSPFQKTTSHDSHALTASVAHSPSPGWAGPSSTNFSREHHAARSALFGHYAETSPNKILFDMRTRGASAKTAKQDGLVTGRRASDQMAKTDLAYMESHEMKGHGHWFKDVGMRYNLPPAILAAIASRESRGGTLLDSTGHSTDPRNKGYGLMQIDAGAHDHPEKHSPYSKAHIVDAARILKNDLAQVKKDHGNWSEAKQLQGAVAAYNFGTKSVVTQAGIDKGTTGGDYSSDVWERARYLAQHHPTMLGGH